ncbi:class I SAM-dependent methyltransferase [Patescibacteria group bacterium]|nr:class I SAM-dependent methyltransferase [Patescibacteria group bacterium]
MDHIAAGKKITNQNTGLLSNYLENQRIKQIVKLIPLGQFDILEIGCGDAKIIDFIRPAIRTYTGIDVLSEQIKTNRQRFPTGNFIEADINQYNWPDQKYDMIILVAFIEHLDYEQNQKLFDNLAKVLSNNGKIIMTTPHPQAEKIHNFGSQIGLFSREAAGEHQCFFGKDLLKKLAQDTSLDMTIYRTFQFGLNQIFIFE